MTTSFHSTPKPDNLHKGHRERLKEQFFKQDISTLNDYQLLELLLFYLIPRKDTNPLAHMLLDRFHTLSGVLRASPQELRQIQGIGKSSAFFFPLLCELERRCRLETYDKNTQLQTLDDIRAYLQPFFLGVHQELVYLLCCNARGMVVGCDLLSQGNDMSVAFNTHLMVEKALLHRASWVVLAHNHPSGFAQPSPEDVYTTRSCLNLLQSLDIHLRDHIIFGDDHFVSMRQSNLL